MTSPSYWPSYQGTYNADDPLVAPWWIPGWTSQDRATSQFELPAGTGNLLSPGFPPGLSFVRVTGNYEDTNGSGAAGFLTLMMSDGITVEDGGEYYRLPQRLTGTMNQGLPFAYQNWGNGVLYLRLGRLDITVFATDQTSSGSAVTTDRGGPLTYWVTEHMLGGRTYQVAVPSSAAPGPVDITTLIVPGTVRPYGYDPVNPMGTFLIPPQAGQPGGAWDPGTVDGGAPYSNPVTGTWDGGSP